MNPLDIQDEALRIETLRQFEVLDSAPDSALDDITSLAAQICNAPVAALSLLASDRILLKSRFGVQTTELPSDSLPCETTILGKSVYEIPDAHLDPEVCSPRYPP